MWFNIGTGCTSVTEWVPEISGLYKLLNKGCAARCNQLLLNCPPRLCHRPDTKNLSADSLPYADDVKLFAPHNHHDTLQNSSTSWCKDWELDLNPTKSKHLPIGNSPVSPLTPSRPVTHPTPRPYQQSPPPKTWELFKAPDSVLKVISSGCQ